MQSLAGAGTAKCLICGNVWRASSNKKRYKCPLCGKYPAHFTPVEEKRLAVYTPDTGEVITETPVVQSRSISTTPLLTDISGEVTVNREEKSADTGEKCVQWSLTHLAWALFLIGVMYAGWYLWKRMLVKKSTLPPPVTLQSMYGYERFYR